MLKAENISFKYDNSSEYVLKDFSLNIKPSDTVGLFGKSGSGKSTLGKIISGFLSPEKGKVTLNDKNIPENGYSPVQMVFQHPEKTVNPRWKAKKIINEAFNVPDEIKENLGINDDWLERYPHELSGGELQRIAVARVLNENTRFLIADEMTSMLDANTQACIWNTVLEHRERYNTGLVVISHDRSLMERLGARVVNF